MRYAIVDADGVVTNVIVLESEAAFAAPEGTVLIKELHGLAAPGGTYVDGVFTPPPFVET